MQARSFLERQISVLAGVPGDSVVAGRLNLGAPIAIRVERVARRRRDAEQPVQRAPACQTGEQGHDAQIAPGADRAEPGLSDQYQTEQDAQRTVEVAYVEPVHEVS